MAEHVASRTLVKSAPELWAECSDSASLARHLGAFGEIRITKLEPETAVAWEGEDVRGTVTLEPAGWGTRVILTALEEGSATVDTAPQAGGVPAQESAVAVQLPDLEEPPVAQQPPVAPAVAEEELLVVADRPSENPPAEDPPAAPASDPAATAPDPVAPAPDPVATAPDPVATAPDPVAPAPDPVAPTPDPVAPRPGFFARLFGALRGPEKARVDANSETEEAEPKAPDAGGLEQPLRRRKRQLLFTPEPNAEPEPAPDAQHQPASEPHPEPAAQPEPPPPPAPQASALVEALDSLGRAHHRPYSRG